ncbi:hypothetical protein OS493_002325 [Desmophyllum pertusum]|uniref:YitH/HolE acetyltransferase (GNAT) domain-containing protein n=1 Tax=Desmophyllum pertusum TaxID=174260 RepID=A0A9W9YST7_9CNID|nr:hypothetical protein OS493_002325 [Desmophyllum pertusum]
MEHSLRTTMTCFSQISEKSPVKIKRIEQLNRIWKLSSSTTLQNSVFGVERHAFLSKWFRVTGSHAHVATNSEGPIVGYMVARPTFIKEEGYKIGPLFADCQSIAEKLLKELLQQEWWSALIDIPLQRVPGNWQKSFKERGHLIRCTWSPPPPPPMHVLTHYA